MHVLRLDFIDITLCSRGRWKYDDSIIAYIFINIGCLGNSTAMSWGTSRYDAWLIAYKYIIIMHFLD